MKKVERTDLIIGKTYRDTKKKDIGDEMVFHERKDGCIYFIPKNKNHWYITSSNGMISFSAGGGVFYED